jgi:hypothetical protein
VGEVIEKINPMYVGGDFPSTNRSAAVVGGVSTARKFVQSAYGEVRAWDPALEREVVLKPRATDPEEEGPKLSHARLVL